jgi:acetyl-CoA C-acetyltransferase
MSSEIVVVSAFRSPVGSFNGSLSALPAHKLGELVIRHILSATGIKGEEISEIILGQVLTAGAGQNPARQASINAGVPKEIPAWSVNHVCGSGLKAIALGYQSILAGQSEIVIAGGQESMSQAPHAVHMRNGTKMGNAELTDIMQKDGLTDAFSSTLMGITAENVAAKYAISREEQDKFASDSQNKAEAAQKSGKFKDEIVPVKIQGKKEEVTVDQDEYIRYGVKFEDLGKLKPAFKKDGTVTAANSSGINDGAAMVMLMKKDEAQKRGLKILAQIKSFGQAGVAPEFMGTGPVPASRKALTFAGWDVGDLDIIEANEAFAAQAIAVNKEMGWDTKKVNVNGGAIAIGHPIGASGARIFVTLIHEMNKRSAKKGLATLCIGGGMGVAMCIER